MELAAANKQIERLRAQLQEEREKTNTLSVALAKKSREHSEVLENYLKVQTENANYRHAESRLGVDELSDAVARAKLDLARAHQARDDLDLRYEQVQEENARLVVNLAETKNQLVEKCMACDDLETQVRTLTSQVGDLQATCQHYKEQVRMFSQQQQDSARKLVATQVVLASRTDELTQLMRQQVEIVPLDAGQGPEPSLPPGPA